MARQRLTAEMRSLRGAAPADVVRRLNPIIRGWTAYHRPVVASEAFRKLDDHLWPLTYRWARRRHPLKSRHWAVSRYFGRFNKSRQDKWVLGDRDSGVYLHRVAWTKIVRHSLVIGRASPDDPALAQYWADRRRKRQPPPLAPSTMLRIKAQHGRCPLCGEHLLFADHQPQSPSQWERWFTVIHAALKRQLIIAGTPGRPDEYYRLVHAHCQRRYTGDNGSGSVSNSNARTPERPA